MKKTLGSVLLASCLLSTSCIGPFNTFNNVTAWNSRVSDSKWVNELVYLGLWVVPVYEIVLTLDSLVFNSIEFWGGENPIGPAKDYQNQGKK